MAKRERPVDPASHMSIKPVEGWVPHGPYGLQRFNDGPNGRLLRLDEVLHWMGHTLEWPRKKAIYAVFSHLIQLDEADPPHRRMLLYVIDRDDYAQPLLIGDKWNKRAHDLWADLPFAHGEATTYDAARQVADLWDECWPGYVQDTDAFYRTGWAAYCKRMKELAQRTESPSDWESAYRERYYVSLEGWIARCQQTVRSLSRLAVSFAVAHELWSWGTAINEAPASPFPLADWPALVAYRKVNTGSDWGLGNQIAVARTELGRLLHDGVSKSNALKSMAKEVGLGSRQAMDKVFSAERMRAPKAVASTSPAATVVRDGRKVANGTQ